MTFHILVKDRQGYTSRKSNPKEARKEAAKFLGCRPEAVHVINFTDHDASDPYSTIAYLFNSCEQDAQELIGALKIGRAPCYVGPMGI